MLEVTPQHGTHGDVFRHARHARPNATNSPHHEVNLYSRRTGGIERFNDLWVLHCIEFQRDTTLGTKRCFIFNQPNDLGLELVRRNEQMLVLGLATITREVVEELCRIATDGFFTGEKADVFVGTGSD